MRQQRLVERAQRLAPDQRLDGVAGRHDQIVAGGAGVGVSTLPLQIYSMIKVAVSPEVNAVSTLLMALTLTLIAIASRLAPDMLKAKT